VGRNQALVNVAVRIRPFNTKEVAAGTVGKKIVSTLDEGQIVFDPATPRVHDDDAEAAPAFYVPGTRREKNISYAFDKIYVSPGF
jgi:hypothetical protein